MKMLKAYLFYSDAALTCDYSHSTAAMGEYILLQVTTRAIEGLFEPVDLLVCSSSL